MDKAKVVPSKTGYLLRKFTVLFFVFSILPLLVIVYLFIYHRGQAAVALSDNELGIIIILTACGCIVAFLVLRRILRKIAFLADGLKKTLLKKVDKQVILDLAKEEGEVAELAKAFGEIMAKLEQNIATLEETKKTLHEVISRSGKVLASVENFDSLIRLVLETTAEALGAQKGIIVSLDKEDQQLVKASVGLRGISKARILKSAGSFIGWVIKEKRALSIPFLGKEAQEQTGEPGEFSKPLLAVPIIFHDKLWGAICLSGKKKEDNFSEDEIEVLSNLSSQIAISFENDRLSADIEKTYFETMSALAMAVEAKDSYSRGHSERVGLYAVEVAKVLRLSEDDVENLRDACRLHDIGKIGIADNILKKPGPLSDGERKIMSKHPIVGESIVRPLKGFRRLLEPIRHHHEFLDGSGYPDKLKASEITLSTRVLTVVDTFEALTSDRPYRKAMTYKKAKKVLEDLVEKGKIDNKAFEALCECVDKGKIKL